MVSIDDRSMNRESEYMFKGPVKNRGYFKILEKHWNVILQIINDWEEILRLNDEHKILNQMKDINNWRFNGAFEIKVKCPNCKQINTHTVSETTQGHRECDNMTTNCPGYFVTL